jgi:hypothetical protein
MARISLGDFFGGEPTPTLERGWVVGEPVSDQIRSQ